MKILIADDHQLFRIGVKSVLKKMPFVSKIQEAENGRQVIEEIKKENFDVILMDINMPVMDGIDATRAVKKQFPDMKVIVLSMYDDQQHVIEMMELGASGYIIKNTTSHEIQLALSTVMNNELYFSKQISENLIKSVVYKHKLKKNICSEHLSEREKEILTLICMQQTTKEIAASLYLSEKTVDWHRLNLLHKTNSKNIVGLVFFAIKNRLFDEHFIINQPFKNMQSV